MKLTQVIKEEYADLSQKEKEELSVNDKRQKKLLKEYDNWIDFVNVHLHGNTHMSENEEDEFFIMDVYEETENLLKKNLQFYTIGDITKFSTSLKKPKNYLPEFWAQYQSGLFLSALINIDAERIAYGEKILEEQLKKRLRRCIIPSKIEHKKNSYLLITPEFKESPNFIGFRNKRADIFIEGDVGKYCGSNMSGGSITINGQTGSYLGEYITGGKITALSTLDYPGFHMKGGEIHIGKGDREKGELPSFTGHQKKGGDIYFYETKLQFFNNDDDY